MWLTVLAESIAQIRFVMRFNRACACPPGSTGNVAAPGRSAAGVAGVSDAAGADVRAGVTRRHSGVAAPPVAPLDTLSGSQASIW